MSIYPPTISAIIAKRSPKVIAGNCEARAVSFDCASMVEFRLRIDTVTKNIDEIAFSSNGCGYMIAAAQSLVEGFEGISLRELHGANNVEILSVIESRTGAVPESRRPCFETAVDSFRGAIANHRERAVGEFSGDVALICSCFGVGEDRIISAIRESHAMGPDDVARSCNAGNGCGSCRMLIQELIDMEETGR